MLIWPPRVLLIELFPRMFRFTSTNARSRAMGAAIHSALLLTAVAVAAVLYSAVAVRLLLFFCAAFGRVILLCLCKLAHVAARLNIFSMEDHVFFRVSKARRTAVLSRQSSPTVSGVSTLLVNSIELYLGILYAEKAIWWCVLLSCVEACRVYLAWLKFNLGMFTATRMK